MQLLKRSSSECDVFTLDNFIFLSIFLFYCFSFNIKGSANAILLLLFILNSLKKWKHDSPIRRNKPLIGLFLVFLFFPLLVLLQILFLPDVNIRQLDSPSRFVATGLLLFGLSEYTRNHKLILGFYGAIFGAIGMGLWGWISTRYIEYAYYMDLGRGSNNFINPIEFGCFSVTLGFLSLILPLPEKASPKLKNTIILLKIIGFIAGMVATICSGSRAALAAAPLFLILVAFHKNKYSVIKITASLLCVISVTIPILLTTRIYTRINDGVKDIATYSTNKNTSIGARFQMWEAAAKLFLENPAIGIGRGNYSKEIKEYHRQGRVSEFLTQFNNAHNEYLNTAAEMGSLGLLSIILLLLFPGIFFYRNYRSNNVAINFSATAGLIFVGGHSVFFLFNSLFLMSCQTTFYSLSVMLFTVIIVNEQARMVSASTKARQ